MLSQAWYALINLHQKRRRLERNEARLKNTATKQKLETDSPSEGLRWATQRPVRSWRGNHHCRWQLCYSAINVQQMMPTQPKPQVGLQTYNIPLFLVTLMGNEKALEILKLTNLGHVIIRVKAYRTQSSLTQCFNCQKFSHVWVKCRQPPCCMWCRGGHLLRNCPEKMNTQFSDDATAHWQKGKNPTPHHVDMALLSDTHMKPHEGVLIQITTFIRQIAFPA